MKRAALVALALTGCAHTQTRYAPTYCVERNQLPTADQCAGKAPAPEKVKALCEPPKVHDQLNGNADHDIKPISGSAVRLRAWGESLRLILGGCVDPNASSEAK